MVFGHNPVHRVDEFGVGVEEFSHVESARERIADEEETVVGFLIGERELERRRTARVSRVLDVVGEQLVVVLAVVDIRVPRLLRSADVVIIIERVLFRQSDDKRVSRCFHIDGDGLDRKSAM